MFDSDLNMPLDYLNFFVVVLRRIHGKVDICQTICPRQCHKQKWPMLFFTCFKLVACVLTCVHAISHIKWRKLHLFLLS